MKLDHIVLFLSDVDRCLPFYEALLPKLGFEKLRDHVFVNDEALHLDFRHASEPERGYHRYAPGLNHLGFTAESREQIEAVGQVMAAAGFDVPEIQQFPDGVAMFLRDLDGMRVELGTYK